MQRTEDKHVDNVEHFTFLALLVLLPALMLTPKDKRSSTFFIALPIVFFACFVLVGFLCPATVRIVLCTSID